MANNNMANLDLEAGATVTHIAQSLFPWASPSRTHLTRSLWVVGSATLVIGVTSAFRMPPAGPIFGRYNPAVYYFIIAVILVAATVEMATAFFLGRSNGQTSFHGFAEGLLPFAILLFLLAVSATGMAIPFKLCN